MTTPNELTLVERPILRYLESMAYETFDAGTTDDGRARENEVLLEARLIDAIQRLNDIDSESAKAIANELATITDNERWIEVLRGAYSRKLPGEEAHRPIRLVDFDEPSNNDWLAVSQLRVRGEVVRKPDVVIYLNGIPVVVIEAKSPLNRSQGTFDAIDQVLSAEREVPRLFQSNLFNIATNDKTFLFGATGAPKEMWGRWRDPWPRKARRVSRTRPSRALYALLDPSRLLDILAHFIVFETRDGRTTKKVCRYQQYRAVSKMVDRVVRGEERRGLIWHTQGSGKSLTMVFAALALKLHRGMESPNLQNPNLLVVTDRIDLHDQITKTFEAAGIKNCRPIHHIRRPVRKDGTPWRPKRGGKEKYFLAEEVTPEAVGKVLLSTVFKFASDDPRFKSKQMRERREALRDLAVEGSGRWILMVDECHRSQEKELGAFLDAMLPNAVRFGLTGTPVKKNDHDTFKNFGAPGERYLDRYGIDDAVKDGATVPIYYQGRLTEWHLHDKEIDILFDQWFAGESEERVEELKRRGVTKGDLARFEPRIDLIAHDIWAHYRASVLPDGMKAQVVAIDRRACVAYKVALDRVIARSLEKTERFAPADARARAAAMSACVYSSSQHDKEQLPEVAAHQLDETETKRTIERFKDPETDLRFLIVCNKLITGFDAPVEQAMYLDNPLTDHNLLQAIARTNRRFGQIKEHGLIVDYIGVSAKLAEALSAYRREDVQSAMTNQDALATALEAAHREVMTRLRGAPRTDDPKAFAEAAVAHLGTEDRWFDFRAKAEAFTKAYAALSPDRRVLPFTTDLKMVAAVVAYGKMRFEQVEDVDWKAYSEKVRAMLDEHLEVTGLKTVCKLRSLTDPGFWDDFGTPEEIVTAAVRKLAELKRETTQRTSKNAARYERFSDRIKELIEQFNQGLLTAEEILGATKEVAEGLRDEDAAHERSGLSERAYGVMRILETFVPVTELDVGEKAAPVYAVDGIGGEPRRTPIEQAAEAIDDLYASEQTAPPYWQDKSQLRKELRRQVRRLVMRLDLDGWQDRVPSAVDHFATQHYAKP